MKAAVLKKIGELTVLEIPTPSCKRGEVLVKVEACGICRTDMKAYYHGQRDLRLPRVLGHEIAGVVERVGAGVDQVKPGDRVQVSPGLPCGCCDFCLQGQEHLCDCVKVMGFDYDGGFAEYVLVPVNGVSRGVLNKLPDKLTFLEAALTEPLACSVHMQEEITVGLGDTVVIFGAGPLGILNARLARTRGAAKIILVETQENRLKGFQDEFDYAVNAVGDDVVNGVQEITGGRGADVVISCCPDPAAFEAGVAVLTKRGRFGFFSGLIRGSEPLVVDMNLIHYRELTMRGAYGCSTAHNRTALRLIGGGQVRVKDLITRVIGLEEVVHGLDMVAGSKETKIVIGF